MFLKITFNKLENLPYILYGYFGSKLPKEYINKIKNPSDQDIKDMIKHLPNSYLHMTFIKLASQLEIKPPKTIRYYVFYSIRLIFYALVAFYIKLVIKKSSQTPN